MKKDSNCSIMEDLMRSIEECNVIRYAAYRAAAKMQILHRELQMQHVSLDLVAGVFERHRLSVTENCVTLDISEIEDVLSDIYFAARKEANYNFDVESLTKICTKYIISIFDKQLVGNIHVFSVKLALILMCSGKLQQKYGYLYHQLADHNACLSKAALCTLLTNICKITDMLGESTAYGYHLIQSHIDCCFSKVESQGCLGVTEVEFAAWVMQEPPLLIWITTFNRMKSAENIIHNIKCSSCKVTPVQGLRYSCLKCTGYHQCQLCYFVGKTSNKHKLKHPVREYCVKTSNRDITKLIIELIRNKLKLCPSRDITTCLDDSPINTVCHETKSLECTSARSTIRKKILSDPQKELQSIINHLEEENRQLQNELLGIRGAKAERLNRHRTTIESQLQRLKLLKKYLFTEVPAPPQLINRMQSTPMLHPPLSRIAALPLEFELSPIIRQETTERQAANSKVDRKEILLSDRFDSVSPVGTMASKDGPKNFLRAEEASTSSGFCNVSESTRIELSTWFGGRRSELSPRDSGFSQWLGSSESSGKENKYKSKPIATSSAHSESPSAVSPSPMGVHRDNTPSSLQRPDKHSQHSSLQNIQGDLNDILDRLQNMVANDYLLEEPDIANDNCKLKRATTEMEDLLTGLIEGMESRKTKLTTVV